jgi:hypothetical protein
MLGISLIALPLLALGCRTNPNQLLLEQESRMLEDKVYHLQAMLEDSHAAREATVRENEALKREIAGGDSGAGPTVPPTGSPAEPTRPSRRRDAPKLEAPTIELPEPSDTPPMDAAPGGDGAGLEGLPTQLVINKRLTGGMDRDGRDGDEGIMVVVEPRDAAGHLIQSPGAVSVVVMDPALEGAATRVARWDFAAGEVTNFYRKSPFGPGLQFELPWPSQPPKHRDLRVFVRLTNAEGTKITSDAAIDVRSPSDPPRAKSWSATESATRPPRKRSSGSRLKSSSSTSAAPRDVLAGERSEASDAGEDSERNESPRQASHADRPAWKPYR